MKQPFITFNLGDKSVPEKELLYFTNIPLLYFFIFRKLGNLHSFLNGLIYGIQTLKFLMTKGSLCQVLFDSIYIVPDHQLPSFLLYTFRKIC